MTRFALKLAAFLLPFAALFAAPMMVLALGGELSSVAGVVTRQMRGTPLLYGEAYSNPVKRFKLLAIQRRRPDVLVLGSSRVMQFRADSFLDPSVVYNGGGSIATVWDFRHVLDRLDPTHPPKVLILGLDQWFFNPNWAERPDLGVHEFEAEDTPLNVIQRNWRAVYQELAAGKISLGRLLAGGPCVGLNAMMQNNGFRNDGSYLYGRVIAEPDRPDHWDPGFQDTFVRIERGERRFEWSDRVDGPAVAELDRALDAAARKGIHVVGVLPPFAPSVLARLRASGRYPYLAKLLPALRPAFEARGFEVVDLTDAGPLGVTDAEFIDGFHGSDKTYLRVTLRLSSVAPSLGRLVDRGELERRLRGATRFEVPPPRLRRSGAIPRGGRYLQRPSARSRVRRRTFARSAVSARLAP